MFSSRKRKLPSEALKDPDYSAISDNPSGGLIPNSAVTQCRMLINENILSSQFLSICRKIEDEDRCRHLLIANNAFDEAKTLYLSTMLKIIGITHLTLIANSFEKKNTHAAAPLHRSYAYGIQPSPQCFPYDQERQWDITLLKRIINALLKRNCIEELSLEGNPMLASALKDLGPLLKQSKSLSSLTLCGFGVKGLQYLSQLLQTGSSIKSLDVSQYSKASEPFIIFPKEPQILHAKDMQNILSFLFNNPQLESLNLSGLLLTDNALKLLANALSFDQLQLTVLNIRGSLTNAQEESIYFFIKALESNTRLITVDLSKNKFSLKLTRCLSLMLCQNEILQNIVFPNMLVNIGNIEERTGINLLAESIEGALKRNTEIFKERLRVITNLAFEQGICSDRDAHDLNYEPKILTIIYDYIGANAAKILPTVEASSSDPDEATQVLSMSQPF